jgi:hypothetical protein
MVVAGCHRWTPSGCAEVCIARANRGW